jgi:hypothetical protein
VDQKRGIYHASFSRSCFGGPVFVRRPGAGRRFEQTVMSVTTVNTEFKTLTVAARVWDSSGVRGQWKHITATVRVEIDYADIARQLAGKAYSNRSRIAKEVKGAVTVRLIDATTVQS